MSTSVPLTMEDWSSRCAAKTADVERLLQLGRGIPQLDGQLRRASACGKLLTFLHDEDYQQHRLETGYFCGSRLCPACAWRSAAHDATRLACIMQQAVADGYRLLFATLTAQNCGAEDLQHVIRAYGRAYVEMMKYGKFKRISGYIRKLEITYNRRDDSYHPHIHSVWFVPSHWGWADYPYTISGDEMTDAWRHQLRLQGITLDVSAAAQDIRAVRSARREDVLEFAKYPAKAIDYLVSRDTLEAFHRALHGTRLLTFAKIAKGYNKQYNDGALDIYKSRDDTDYWYRSYWDWTGTDYCQSRMDKLDEKINIGACCTDEGVTD